MRRFRNHTFAALLKDGRKAWAILTDSPVDQSTSESRSHDRYRRAFWSTLTAVAAKLVTMLSLVISVPLTLHYLGSERYAVWMTVASAITILGVLDLGVGNGLITILSQYRGLGDRRQIQAQITAAYAVVTAVMAVAILAFFSIYSIVPWSEVFNVKSPLAQREVGPTVAVFFVALAIGLPFNLVHKVQISFQEGVASNAWNLVGSLLSLLGLVVALYCNAGLPWLVVSITLGGLVASGLNTFVFFAYHHAEARPLLSSPDRGTYVRLLNLGMMFLVLQAAVMISLQSHNLILSHVLGPGAVTEYATTARLFAIVPILLSLLLGPLWPAYGEALARGDGEWARSAFHRSIVLSLWISIPLNAALAIGGQSIIGLWVGGEVVPGTSLLWGFAVIGVLTALSGPCAIFLNAIAAMRFQAVFAVLMAICSIGFGIMFTRQFGVSGVVWAAALSISLCSVLPSLIRVRNRLDEITVQCPSDTQHLRG